MLGIPAGIALVMGALALHSHESLPERGWLLVGAWAAVLARLVAATAKGRLLATRASPAPWSPPRHRTSAVATLRTFAWLCFGYCWAGLCAHSALADRLATHLEGRDLRIEGVVEGLPQRGPHGWTLRFAVERALEPADALLPRAVRLFWPDAQGGAPANPVPRGGERWRIDVRLRLPHALANPHGFDAELRSLEEGIGAAGTVRLAASRGQDLASPDADPAQAVAGRAVRTDAPALTPAALLAHAREHVRRALAIALGARDAAAAAAGVPGFGILAALTVGDQAALPPTAWAAFNRTGIGHLLSISGLHVTMLAALGALAAGTLWRSPWVARRGWPLVLTRQHVRVAAGVFVALAYSLLAGWGIPAQRTFWMLAVAGAALVTGRGASLPAALAAAAGLVTVMDPWAPLAAGFWLSFGAVAALAWALSRASPRAEQPVGRVAGLRMRIGVVLSTAAATQVAATLATLPLSAAFFGSVSLVGPLANAVAIPLVGGLLAPAALAGAGLASISPAAAAPLLAACAWVADLVGRTALAVGAWPLAAWPVPAAPWPALALGVAATAWLLGPRALPFRAAAAVAMLAPLLASRAPPPAGTLRVTALDVGQGMAVLVESGSRTLLYDTGPAWGPDSDAGARVVLPHLRARGIDRLDLLVISHPDADHAGGAASVLAGIAVDEVVATLPDAHPAARLAPARTRCAARRHWRWEALEIEALHPEGGAEQGATAPDHEPDNASSCVLRLSPSTVPTQATQPKQPTHPMQPTQSTTPSPLVGRVLLAGDIGVAQERRLVAAYGPAGLRADVLLVPHHGSKSSSSTDFVQAVSPAWGIVQAGYRNRWRHPDVQVANRYGAVGTSLLRSDRDGAVTIELRSAQRPAERATVLRERLDRPRYWRVPWTEPPAPLNASRRGRRSSAP